MIQTKDMKQLQAQVRDRYGFALTEDQVKQVLDSNNDLAQDIEMNGTDTMSREWFINAMSRLLGVKGHWPLSGEPQEAKDKFFVALKVKADERGFKYTQDSLLNDVKIPS